MCKSNTFVDFGKAADDYARHRKTFPISAIDRMVTLGVGIPGQSIVDIGTGTGLFGLEFARLGCEVVGIDPSEKLLEKARSVAADEQLNARFIRATAEKTTLPSGIFDVVVCATAWHWFDHEQAAAEAMRLLKPGGKLVIAVLGWHFLPENLPTKTVSLIEEHVPQSDKISLSTFQYPAWTEQLVMAGFSRWEMFSYIEPILYSHEDWCGRVRASQGIGPVLDASALERFSRSLRDMLQSEFPQDPYPVDHRIEAIVAWT